MNTNKLLIGTLIGGVAFFALGAILYGMLLKNTMAEMMPGAAGVMRADADMNMVAMIVGNLAAAFLLAYIFERWAGIRSFMGGMVAGATIAGLIALSYDSMMHGTTTLMTWGGVILDTVVSAVMGGVAGGVIGWWLGYNRKP